MKKKILPPSVFFKKKTYFWAIKVLIKIKMIENEYIRIERELTRFDFKSK